MTTVTVNGHEVEFREGSMGETGACYGSDWERVLSGFDLELPPDTFEVAATLTFRDVRGDQARRGSARTNLFLADYKTTVEFKAAWVKKMAVRYYWIARRHGAPPIIARWMVSMECQRLIGRYMDGSRYEHLHARFADTREEGEIESDNADEAVRVLDGATDGGSWGWEDGELWLYPPFDLEEDE